MKARNAFVSNSSSSSFLIAFNEPKKCDKCGCTPKSIIDLIEESDSSETRVEQIFNLSCLDDFKDSDNNNRFTSLKESNIKEAKEADFTHIVECEISYHDEEIHDLIRKEEGKSIKTLYGWYDD